MNSIVETILLYTIAAGFLSIVYGYFTGKNILSASATNTARDVEFGFYMSMGDLA